MSDVLACAAVAVVTAVGASFLGVRLRALCADLVGNDYVGAGLEDALGIGLGWLATRTPSLP